MFIPCDVHETFKALKGIIQSVLISCENRMPCVNTLSFLDDNQLQILKEATGMKKAELKEYQPWVVKLSEERFSKSLFTMCS